MGYTNHWRILKDFSHGEWQTVMEIFQTKIQPNFHNIISSEIVDKGKLSYIKFNGIAEGEHEDFMLFPFQNNQTQFCKTNRKAYDSAVWEFLVRLECHFPEHITITNDDDPRILGE